MSIFEDEILNNSTKHIPNLQLAQDIFLLEHHFAHDEEALKASVMQTIEEEKMAPLYTELCERLGWDMDSDFEAQLRYVYALFSSFSIFSSISMFSLSSF